MAHSRIKILNGRLIDPANQIDELTDLYIDAGKIVAPHVHQFQDARTIDARNQIICPGLIDLRVALREPGFEHKGTIKSETKAAAKGGITRVVIEPDTLPVVDTPAVVELIQQRASQAGQCRVSVLGALTKGLKAEQLSEMGALARTGCVGVSQARAAIADHSIWRRALAYASTFDLPLFSHPLDFHLSEQGVMHQSSVSTQLGLRGIPTCAETVAVAAQLQMFSESHSAGHFCNLTSEIATRMLGRAQFDGVPVSADVAIPNLFFTDVNLMDFDCRYLLHPPLRSANDRAGLIRGLKEGIIQAICSDHLPHEADAKRAPLNDAQAGISGLETLLGLIIKLAHDEDFSYSSILSKVTCAPAKIIGLDGGHLGIGAPADICIFDTRSPWIVDSSKFVSQGKFTPFNGWQLPAQVTHTILGGKLVYQR